MKRIATILALTLSLLSACATPTKVGLTSALTPTITTIDLGIANVFLVSGQRHLLIDSGSASTHDELIEALNAHGVSPSSLSAVILTHGHADHAGGAAMLHRRFKVPIIVAQGDEPMLKAGKNRPLKPIGVLAHIIRPFVDDPFDSTTPQVIVSAPTSLKPWGVEGQIIPAPGHTPGALIVRLQDGRSLVGDALRSSVLNDACPEVHFFHDDAHAAHKQIASWLPEATTIYVGHGGPLEAQQVRRWYAQAAR